MPNNDWNALSQRHKNPVLLVLPFLVLMLSLLSTFSAAATAAQPSPQANSQQKASYAALANILQDDKSRAELIAHLRSVQNCRASSTRPGLRRRLPERQPTA